MRHWVLLSAATALLVAGCGGGGDGTDSQTEQGQEYVDAIMVGSDDEDLGLDENQVRCAAEGWVDLYGIETFEDAGVSPDDIRAVADDEGFPSLMDFTDEQADGFVDVLVECVDFGDVFAASLAEDADAPELSDEQIDCIGSRMEETEDFREAVKAGFLGGDAPDVDMRAVAIQAFDACGVSFSDLLSS